MTMTSLSLTSLKYTLGLALLLLRLKVIAYIYSVLYLSDAGLTCSMLACRLLDMLVCITRCRYIQLWAIQYLLVIAYVSTILWSVQCHQHTPSMSFCLHDLDGFTVDFEQAIPVICFLPCLLTRYWFVSCH